MSTNDRVINPEQTDRPADVKTSGKVVWCDAGFKGAAAERFRQGVRDTGYELVLADEPGASLSDADIAFGQPDPASVLASPRLRWVQITSAGYTRYDTEDFRDGMEKKGATFTNSSHVYDEPCAQHALAMILSFARQLPRCLEDQRDGHAWRTGLRRRNAFLLNGQSIVFLGYGAIGRRLAQLLAPFNVRVLAVRRTPSGDEARDGVEARTEAELDEVLPLADHVVNVLPESPSTKGFLTAERFNKMKEGAFFYNIGRGATVDQDALIAALASGRVGAAYLDVTSPEPLPPQHPLWDAPNCFITPHSAGGHADESERLVEHFLANLAAYRDGEPLQGRVFGRG